MLAPYAIAVVLADDSGGESKKAGPIALVVILLLAISCYFLFRSMTKHLRRVRDDFPAADAPGPSPGPPPGPPPGPASADSDHPTAPTLRESGPGESEPPPG